MGSVILAILRFLEIVGYTISIPAERTFFADVTWKDMRETSYGLYTFSFFLGSALGPLAWGWGGYMTILDKPGRFILIQ